MRGSTLRRWWDLAARTEPRAAGRPGRAGAALALGLLLGLAGDAAPERPTFEVRAPQGMVTGRVRLEAVTGDQGVAFVRWQAEDWSRTTGRPFELVLDVGAVPREKTVVAVALDHDRRPLYRTETLLNPGGRRLALQFLAPLDGQHVSGRTSVLVHAVPPPADALEYLALDVDGHEAPLLGEGDTWKAEIDFAGSPVVVTVRAKTALSRSAERSILLNGRGLQASLDAHVVEQMVAVVKGGEPVEGLKATDFTVRDDRGPCEVREARLVRDVNLAIGLAIDTSQSLLYTQELRNVVARRFLGMLGPKDTTFLQRFGVAIGHVLDWTTSRKEIEESVLALDEDTVPGTLLHAAVVDALYQLQGGGGARALVLVTDGNAFDDDLAEKDALAFARQTGVPIFAIGLPWVEEVQTPTRRKDENGNSVEVMKVTRKRQPPNRAVLERFTDASGGRTYVVESAESLPALFARLERDLRTHYVVSFVSNAKHNGSFHPVEIRAARGTVRTADGFSY